MERSIYEGLSAKELVELVGKNGLNKEDIGKAREIFGRTANKVLIELANSPAYAQAFYVVLFSVWNWQEANTFCNNYSCNTFKAMVEENDKLVKELEAARVEAEENKEDC